MYVKEPHQEEEFDVHSRESDSFDVLPRSRRYEIVTVLGITVTVEGEDVIIFDVPHPLVPRQGGAFAVEERQAGGFAATSKQSTGFIAKARQIGSFIAQSKLPISFTPQSKQSGGFIPQGKQSGNFSTQSAQSTQFGIKEKNVEPTEMMNSPFNMNDINPMNSTHI